MTALELADDLAGSLYSTHRNAADMLHRQHNDLLIAREAIQKLRGAVQFLIETSSYEAEAMGEQALKDTEGLCKD